MSQPVESPHKLFSFERFRFTIKVAGRMVLPPYKGAVFRGAFGNAFRRVVCAVPRADCATCLLRLKCLYVAVFEPPPPANYPDAEKFSKAPPPYVLNPPLTDRRTFHPGDNLEFELVLIGPAIEALPYFIYTFVELGRKGLGAGRGRYELARVDLLRGGESTMVYNGLTQLLAARLPQPEKPQPVPEDGPVNSLTLDFLTPLRLKVKGDLATRLTFPLFFERLVQRLSLLSAFYNLSASIPDFSPLLVPSQSIQVITDKLRWYDWERYSGRQESTMKFGGLLGRITFHGALGLFLPLLKIGEQLNVGQQTTFGLGRFRIEHIN